MHRRPPWIVLATAALCCAALPGHAGAQQPQMIIFNDGFTIEGRVKQETSYIGDPKTGVVFTVPTSGKPNWIDDGVRAIFFSPFQLADAWKDEVKKNDQLKFELFPYKGSDPLPMQWTVEAATEWDNLERVVTLYSANTKKEYKITQRIHKITPDYICITSKERKWTVYYKTSECDPDLLRKFVFQMVAKQKEYKGKELEQRGVVYKYLIQAGFVDTAEKEVEAMLARFPDQKSNIQALQDDINRIRAVQLVEALERADKLGMHKDVADKLAQYASDKIDRLLSEKMQLKVQAIKNKQDTIAQKLKDSKVLLAGFANIASDSRKKLFKDASATILDEVGPETIGRLDTFLSQAQDYERALKDKRKPDQTADEVLAFALTGWMRGSDAAERSPEVAVKQWEIRQVLLEYLQTDKEDVRTKKLLPWLQTRGVSVDEAMQMIRLLPPPDALDPLPVKATQLTAKVGKVSYDVQLPPGYTHGKPWPVLITLHHSQEKPAEAVKRWTELAAKYGFIVVAPQWGKGLKVNYQYSAEEHLAVLDTLRDVRRRFNVDSDRVFLFGGEQGGQAAFDIGLSHPGQFAGVIPMAANVKAPGFIPRYWSNAQYLHLYIINGDLASKESHDNMRFLCKDWIRLNYPAIYVEYKGRPAEWFSGEPSIIFDWMNRKKRILPLKDVGAKDQEFKILRPTENQFYWLSVDAVSPSRLIPPTADEKHPIWSKVSAAKVSATVFGNNTIHVDTIGIGKVTIWFCPKLVNYANEVTFKVNGGAPFKKLVTPNLETLLETLYQSGDRQRMFFARADFKV